MTEDQADRIIELLEDMNKKLDYIETNTSKTADNTAEQ